MFWERVASPECKTEQKWIWHSYIMSNQSAEAKGMIEFQTFPLLFLQGKAGGGEHFNKWACWHFLSWKIIFPLEKSFVREVSEFLQPAAFFFLKRLGVLWTGYWKGHLHHRTCEIQAPWRRVLADHTWLFSWKRHPPWLPHKPASGTTLTTCFEFLWIPSTKFANAST